MANKHKSMDPYYTDINLLTSSHLQAHLSDYHLTLEAYPGETVLSNAMWYAEQFHDPLFYKYMLFCSFSSGLGMPTDQLGYSSLPDDIKLDDWISSIKNKTAFDQVDYDWVQLEKVDGTTATTKKIQYNREWLPNANIKNISVGEWVTAERKTQSTHEIEVKAPPAKGYDNKGTLTMEKMPPWARMYWLEKFRTAHPEVKKRVKKGLKVAAPGRVSFFDNFSESIGQLKNIKSADDVSSLPIWDVNCRTVGPPIAQNPVVQYIMTQESKKFTETLSKESNSIYRDNLKNLAGDDSSIDDIPLTDTGEFSPQLGTSTGSHGLNLVNDSQHRVRHARTNATVRTSINEMLGGTKDISGLAAILEFIDDNVITSGKNKMEAKSVEEQKINLKVENTTLTVDTFKNKLKYYSKPAESRSKSYYGKGVQLNNGDVTNSMIIHPVPDKITPTI